MAKVIEGIRVELVGNQIKEFESNVWLTEHLRYAGYINRPKDDYQATDNDPDYIHKYFTMWTPKGVTADVWASQQIGRLASFGIKATIQYRR
jgi:hypothetical protein